MFKNKSIIMIIIICLTLVFLIIDAYLLVNKFNLFEKKDKVILCTSEKNDKYNTISEIHYDKTGAVTNVINTLKINYENAEEYNLAKKDLNDKEAKYIFDDKKFIITQITSSNKEYDKDGNEVLLWYYELGKSLENIGFTCKTK